MGLANDGDRGNDSGAQMENVPEEHRKAFAAWEATLPIPIHDRRTCQHLNFAAYVSVDRICKGDVTEKPSAFLCEVRVRCIECQIPFEFVGVNAGLLWDRPCCDASAQELRIPIQPKGVKLLPGIPGFSLRAN